MCVLIELPLTRFTGRRHPGRVLAVGMALQCAGVGMTGLADGRETLVLTVVLWSLAETIYTPVATTYPGLLAPGHLRGRYQGAEGIAVTLAQSVGPALGGFLYAMDQALHWSTAAAVGLAGVLVILLCPDPREHARRVAGPAVPAPDPVSEASVPN
jgi:MFS family permease